MGIMAHAPFSVIASLAGFGSLLLARIRVEERALGCVEPAGIRAGVTLSSLPLAFRP